MWLWLQKYSLTCINAHISYLAVKVPPCSCSPNTPSCLNSKTTICVSQISITAQRWSRSTHTKGGQKYSWLQLCSVIQGIKNDCKIGKVPSITLSIMWIHVAIYRGGISGMVNIHNNMKKVVQTQVIFKFWSTDGFGPKLSNIQVLKQLGKYSL